MAVVVYLWLWVRGCFGFGVGYRLFILGDGFRYKFYLIFVFGTAGSRRLDVESVGRVLSIRKYWIRVLSGEEKSMVYALGSQGVWFCFREKRERGTECTCVVLC